MNFKTTYDFDILIIHKHMEMNEIYGEEFAYYVNKDSVAYSNYPHKTLARLVQEGILQKTQTHTNMTVYTITD